MKVWPPGPALAGHLTAAGQSVPEPLEFTAQQFCDQLPSDFVFSITIWSAAPTPAWLWRSRLLGTVPLISSCKLKLSPHFVQNPEITSCL